MIKVIKHENMGRSDRGWLHSLFHFSFAEYYKPDNIKFGALRVVNDDRFDPHGGFGMHPHDNMEIISYVVDGQLTHRDSLGNGSRLERGDVQYMSAGSGIWDGSGHKMAYWAGAAVDKNETPTPMIFCFQWRSITRQVRAFQGLMVNSDGRRYDNEDNVISHGALALTHEKGHYAYAIWDDDYANEPQWQNHRYVDGPKVFETPDDVRAYWQTTIDGPGTINMNGSGDIEVKMIKADTIEKLVEELGLPKEETLKTIEAYNGYCDKGVDEEFGKRKELLLPVKNGPFYGIKCTPWFLTTTGGIRCNDDMQVMDEDNEVIEGLYCLGSTVGDMYCNCYSTHFPGHNLGGTCLTFGYVTGRKLAGAE